jgi:protein gp37
MKTQIEWVRNKDGTQGYTINPVKGLCPMACEYCYARRMYKRFKWNPEIRFDWSVANDLPKMKAGSRVFWGSTMELFGDWVDSEWQRLIFEAVKRHPELTHMFLTKCPQNLPMQFPENCWVGVTATNQESYYDGVSNIAKVQAEVKFVSFEPLLEQINGGECAEEYRLDSIDEFDWVIIGQQTPASAKTQPKIEWIREIVEAADKTGVKVFLKDNLESLLPLDILFYTQVETNGGPEYRLRQELPGD